MASQERYGAGEVRVESSATFTRLRTHAQRTHKSRSRTHRNMSSITALVCFLALASYSSLCGELLGCSAPTPLLQQLEPGHTDFMIMIHEIPYTGAEVAPTASVIGRRQLSDTPIDTPGVALVTAYSKSDQQRMGWVELFQRAARAGLAGGEAT